MPKLILMSGGPGRRVMTWSVSRQTGLSRDYVFAPGVPVAVTDADALWLLDIANTGGRVFDVATEKGVAPQGGRGLAGVTAAEAAAATATLARGAGAGQSGTPTDTPTPADKPTTGKPSGDADKT